MCAIGVNVAAKLYKDVDMECLDPFVNLKITEEGRFSARNFNGFEYIIDINTGDATLIAWHK